MKISLRKAVLYILLSTLLISGSAFMGWIYYLHVRERKFHEDQYRIAAIVQSTSQSDKLKTVYLAEMLDLSLDQPVNLYQYHSGLATKTLLNSPVIRTAAIKKILPGILYIQYEMRIPLAYIGDWTNTVIDEEGFLFPFRPFFTPKHIPTFILGLEKEECEWGKSVKDSPSVKLAFYVWSQFEQLPTNRFYLKQLDVSQAFSNHSYGKRQIVIVLEEKKTYANESGDIIQKGRDGILLGINENELRRSNAMNIHQGLKQRLFYLRLSVDRIEQDLINFFTLQRKIFEEKDELLSLSPEQPFIIDLRLPHLVFIQPKIWAKIKS